MEVLNKMAITVRKVDNIGWAVFKNGKQVSTVGGKATTRQKAVDLRKRK